MLRRSHPRAPGTRPTCCRLGRFNKEADSPTVADPYDMVRFVHNYERSFGQACEDIRMGRRKLSWNQRLMPAPPHYEGGVEFGNGQSRIHSLVNLDGDTTRGDRAAEAFLRFPPMRGVHLRRDYHHLCCLLEEHVVNCDRPPVGPIGIPELKKIIASMELFREVARRSAPEVADVCDRVLPRLPAKWPMPGELAAKDGRWMMSYAPYAGWNPPVDK